MTQSEATFQHRDANASSDRFSFVGGDPCVDFINTLESWLGTDTTDRLSTYQDLLDWSVMAGILSRQDAARLSRSAADRTADAARVLTKARSLRTHLYEVLRARAVARPPNPPDLEAITSFARRAAAHSRLEPSEGRYAWILDETKGNELDWPVWEIARRAVALLTSESLQRVRQCADETCGWMFIDRSRNHSRRWCDMATCGNRAKARRNYARRKADRARDEED